MHGAARYPIRTPLGFERKRSLEYVADFVARLRVTAHGCAGVQLGRGAAAFDLAPHYRA